MNVAIIAAAGQGVRMGTKRAKQFLELDGIPVLIHTLRRFEDCADIDEVVVVLPGGQVKRFPALALAYGLSKVVNCIPGGKTRAESVHAGLCSIRVPNINIIAVHDGVRPFVTPKEISQTIAAAKRHGVAILTAPVTDTIKVVRGKYVVFTPPREELRRALTPQCFQDKLLRRAFAQIGWYKLKAELTDESMLFDPRSKFMRFGNFPRIRAAVVEGNGRNLKITRPEDIALAEIILKQNPEFRIKKPK